MTHEKHVHLIKKAIPHNGGKWADLGSGDGAFTLALRDLAGPDITIYSIDRDEERLHNQKEAFDRQFPHTTIQYIHKDFTEKLTLKDLDGIIMANSLHYIENKVEFLNSIMSYLKPHGKLVLIEYSIDTGNHWVPYPLSFGTFEKLATQVGFENIELLERIPSTYWDEMYSTQAEKLL